MVGCPIQEKEYFPNVKRQKDYSDTALSIFYFY